MQIELIRKSIILNVFCENCVFWFVLLEFSNKQMEAFGVVVLRLGGVEHRAGHLEQNSYGLSENDGK